MCFNSDIWEFLHEAAQEIDPKPRKIRRRLDMLMCDATLLSQEQ